LRPGDVTAGRTVSAGAFLPGCLSCRGDAAFDNDPNTAWQTPYGEARGQWAEVDSANPVTLDHLDLAVIADGRHSVPSHLRLDVDGTSRELALPAIADKKPQNATTTVHLAFPAVRGRRIRITIDGVRDEQTRLFGGTGSRIEPVGFAEIGVPGVAVKAPETGAVDSGCRSDLVAIDGQPLPVRVTGRASAAQAAMGLAVTACSGPRELAAGTHVLTTAPGKQVGLSIDRVALASGAPAVRVSVGAGRVSVGDPAPASPPVTVVHNGDTKLRVHVNDATKPFWLVLGESQSPGWHAHVVGGSGLGPSQLVDGYANGWLISPPASGSFDVVFEWTPQRQVWTAIWLSLLGVLLCVGVIAFTWIRRRAVITTASTARTGDDEVDLSWTMRAPGAPPGPEAGRRLRWVAPSVSGVLGALVVAPWVGVLIAAVVFVVLTRPRLRPWVMLAPGGLLALCALYIVVEQSRYRYPSVFEWPTVFPRARTLAWIAVMLLAADGIVEILRCRPARGPNAKRGPGPDSAAP